MTSLHPMPSALEAIAAAYQAPGRASSAPRITQ